ncbi:MAG: glutamine synthetase type III [Erysipelotrichaceae bacterium]|nr:glutamine synthetase type III [Erysipelotrichaceae bacterium]
MYKNTVFDDFGSLVFNEKLMEERLPRPVYNTWKKTIAKEGTLDRATADAIAHAMKTWALENNTTHFSHWFHPMTSTTAEKHDSFVEPGDSGEPLLRFSGKSLIKGESDASSFPSGGLRATFEARGYTYWDFTSPAFIRDRVLYIPTVFVSYNGESLDKKAPLLKSIEAISTASTRVVNLLGDKDVKYCTPVVGLEQEYFLIDKSFYEKRLDLLLTGRTLFGACAPKGQELEDHYFGNIPSRVNSFMNDVNIDLWKLGIYAKAEHNEAAPAQFEIAPIFSNANIAIDQNQLIMDILKKTAEKHNLACLLHEKPFSKINGSGKHNNYSIITNDGQNLYSPGDKPSENIRFLLFMCAFIKAVDTYPELLRMASSSAGNDHRLGSSEAPPAIISIYLGSYIETVLYNIYKSDKNIESHIDKNFNPIHGLSYIPHDNADRNRTSPIAFTGNKFEFRMLGSSLSASLVNTVLNSSIAEALNEIADSLEGIKYINDVRDKALSLCQEIISNHKRIIFSGDGYSKEWIKEAKRRGLPNITSFIESVPSLLDDKSIHLFTSLNIYSEKELRAHEDIFAEQYQKTIELEAKTLIKICKNEILPLMVKELKLYGETYNACNKLAPNYLVETIKKISTFIENINKNLIVLNEQLTLCNQIPYVYEKALKYHNDISPLLCVIRESIDKYEIIASKDIYDIPTYTDMLFKKL